MYNFKRKQEKFEQRLENGWGGGHLHVSKMENVERMVCLLLHLTLNS